MSARMLLVEDERALRTSLSKVFTRAGYEVVEAEDGERAIALAAEGGGYDVVLSDVRMPGATGVDVLRAIRARDLDVPLVLMTGMPELATAMAAVELGAFAYLTKPLEIDRLEETISRAIRVHRLAVATREAGSLSGAAAGARDRVGLEIALDRALAGMHAAFQPIVRASDGSVFAYEALMRTREPSLPHPGAVLDAADALGRLPDVGRRMRALAAKPMDRAGDALLFVNLHPLDLHDRALGAADAPLAALAERVVFEITERASLDALGDAPARVAALRAQGYRIAIDDLGAGYAGLSSFVHLDRQIVKLDMSLVRGVDASATKRKLVGSVTALCHDLGLLVVGEGVETREERDALIELGCDLLQGYLIARPGPAFPIPSSP